MNGRSSLSGKTVVVTGANGGIGRALVDALVEAGAGQVIAAMRCVEPHPHPAVRPVRLEVTSKSEVREIARNFGEAVDILINNAGVNANLSIMKPESPDAARREMEVNFFGLLNMMTAFGEIMRERRRGVIANVLSSLAHMNLPTMASYCSSKAAALSLTQAFRAELSPYGVRVCSVFPPVVDTRMSAHLPRPKISPQEVAAAVLTGLIGDEEDIYIGAAAEIFARLREDPKALERHMAARLTVR